MGLVSVDQGTTQRQKRFPVFCPWPSGLVLCGGAVWWGEGGWDGVWVFGQWGVLQRGTFCDKKNLKICNRVFSMRSMRSIDSVVFKKLRVAKRLMKGSMLQPGGFAAGAIALGLVMLPAHPTRAQEPSAPATSSELTELGERFKLNSQQRQAIGAIGELALDQMEMMLSNGLDPQKLDRVETQRKTDNIRQIFSTLKLDEQQKAALKTILRSARDQIRRQMESDR